MICNHSVWSPHESPQTLAVMLETGILFAILSGTVMLIFIATMCLYVKKRGRWIGKTTIAGLLLFAALTMFNADMILGKDEKNVYVAYVIVKSIIFILVFVFVPYFFEPTDIKHHQIGHLYEGIGFFTIPLTIFLFVGEIGASAARFHVKGMSWRYFLVAFVPALQKLFQCLFFHYLILKRKPRSNKSERKGSMLWLSVMAMFNFSMWVQSIVEEVYGQDNVDRGRYLWGKDSVEQTYYAMIIDFRLLWSLLFLELAHHIYSQENVTDEDIASQEPEPDSVVLSNGVIVKRICFGAMSGILIFGVQFFNIPKCIKEFGADVHIAGIMTEIFLVCCGFLVVWKLKLKSYHFKQTNRGFDMMVAMLGVCGLLFWILKGFLLTIWTYQAPDNDHFLFSRFAGKFWIRGLACIFHIYLYMHLDVSLTHNPQFRANRWSCLFAPLLCGFYAAVFVNAAADNVNETVKYYLESSDIHVTPKWIYRAGGPIYLGFVLHLVIHYFMFTVKLIPKISLPCILASGGRSFPMDAGCVINMDEPFENIGEMGGEYRQLRQQVSVT